MSIKRTPAMAELLPRTDDVFARREDMRKDRQPFEAAWRDITTYALPRRSTDALMNGSSLLPMPLIDNTAVVANERLAATLHGHLFQTHEPFIVPLLEHRETRNQDERLWLEAAGRIMFDFMSGSRSTFRPQLAESLLDATSIGTPLTWIGGELGKPPTYKSVSVLNAFIEQDEEDGRINTVYREFTMPLWRAAKKYPTKKILEMANSGRYPTSTPVKFLHIVEPRFRDRPTPIDAKPFIHGIYHDAEKELVEAGTFSSFPYAAGRMMTLADHTYGFSPSFMAMGMAKALNTHRYMSSLRSEYDIFPPYFDLTGGQMGPMDLRPGAGNSVDPGLYRMFADHPIKPAFMPGDSRSTLEEIRDLRTQIQFTYYIDWQQYTDEVQKTATEIADRRDMRMRTMSPTIARLEQEMMTAIAERTFDVMLRARMFPPMPESLRGESVIFEYRSPISLAQRGQDLEALMRTIDFATGTAQLDPASTKELDFRKMVRLSARLNGAPEDILRPEDEAAEEQARDNEAAQTQQQLDQAATAGQALRDGGAGLASIEQGGGE